MSKIFISYRRDDSHDSTGRIFDRLKSQFGLEQLVRDVDSIPTGVDFREYLAAEVNKCQVLVAVIGRHWQDIKDASGKRRLDDPRDMVRIEIETALQRNIPIIPVIVGGAAFPDEKNLPPSIKGIVHRNGVFVRPDPDFHPDVDRLIQSLEAVLRTGGAPASKGAPRARRGIVWILAGATVFFAVLLLCGGLGVLAIMGKLWPSAGPPATAIQAEEKATPASNNGTRGLSKAVRNRAMSWVRENNKWNPTAPIVTNLGDIIEDDKKQCFVVTVGGTLLKSKKTTVLAGRGEDFFLFELTDAQAKPFPPGATGQVAGDDRSIHPKPPHIELTNLRLENAERHNGGPLRGSVQYTRRVKHEGNVAVRVIYYASRKNLWVTAKEPPVPLGADQGTLSFNPKENLAAEPGPAVIFVELVEDGGTNRIVSNTVAGVVTVGDN